MKIKFILYGDDYALKSNPTEWTAICGNVLRDYFDLSDNPEKITFTLSKKNHPDSYFVKAIRKEDKFAYLNIKLSGGDVTTNHVYTSIFKLINRFPSGCYVSVD